MKYLVMECHLSYAVVLGEDGRFLKVANMHYETGQTVTDIVEMRTPQAQPEKKTNRRWVYSLAALAACLTLVVTSVFQMGQVPYASVYMSINPEVRIDVNREDMVVELEGVNTDGDVLIEGYSHQKKELDLVMDELVDRAIDMGYLHEGGQITLTLDAEDNEWIVSKEQTLSSHLQEYLTERISVTIEIGGMNGDIHDVSLPSKPNTVPPDDSYEEEDYGMITIPVPSPQQTPPGDSGTLPDNDAQTDYETSTDDDGQSNYETTANDGSSNYEITPDDDGASNYETTPDDDGTSNYETTPDNDKVSNYETTATDDGQSNYEAAGTDNNQSDDLSTDTDDGQSDYETESDDD